jgi:hypothetical protein
MKLAIFSESSADEAAIHIFVETILGLEIELIGKTKLRTRGWPSVLQTLAAVIYDLYYQTDAEALIVVVDADDSPIHKQEHEQPNMQDADCRVCKLQDRVATVQKHLSSTSTRNPLKIAIGLAVPAIEAWYLCGADAHCTEGMMIQKQGSKGYENRRALKKKVYGTDRPSLELETQRAIEEAMRLANSIADLEQLFPDGFGTLVRHLRAW